MIYIAIPKIATTMTIMTIKKRKEKDWAMDMHVKKRFLERFSYRISDDEISHICNLIMGKKHKFNEGESAEFLFRDSYTRSFWRIKYKDMDFIAIYYPGKRKLRTVMPLSYLENRQYYFDTIDGINPIQELLNSNMKNMEVSL